MINLMNLLSIKISVIMGMEEITEEIKTTTISREKKNRSEKNNDFVWSFTLVLLLG